MRQAGFTLLEILIVVVLIGLLATLVGPHVLQGGREGQRRIALAKCREYHDAVAMWCMFKAGSPVPRSLEELATPLHPGERDFLRIEPDPWGGPYRLVREEGRDYRVWSNGPDGEQGTGDDICYEPLDG